VYRDLKPENVLLNCKGHVVLADFGLAKRLKDFNVDTYLESDLGGRPVRKTYSLCGTPQYMSPEILHEHGHDTSCDWWSLGILIYELSSG